MVAIDLSSFELPVLMAAEHELAAHEELLVQLDKSSNGRTLFRARRLKMLWHNRRLRTNGAERFQRCCSANQPSSYRRGG